jgi:ABC-type hemin transport system ATPase subunit
VIEHDLPLVTSVSDRMLAMEVGRVIAEGKPDEVVRHPDVVSAYLGASQTTIQRSGAALSEALSQAGILNDKEGPNGHGS